MGLIAFLKEKFAKKDKKVDKYQEGLSKSRKNFSSKLNNLSERYKTVNQDYFDELEQILIESDAGVLQGQICLLPQVFLTSYFCIPVPYNEKAIFFGC